MKRLVAQRLSSAIRVDHVCSCRFRTVEALHDHFLPRQRLAVRSIAGPRLTIRPHKGWQPMGFAEIWRFRELFGSVVWGDTNNQSAVMLRRSTYFATASGTSAMPWSAGDVVLTAQAAVAAVQAHAKINVQGNGLNASSIGLFDRMTRKPGV